jgi:DNA-binding transcriptional LysR family regulator
VSAEPAAGVHLRHLGYFLAVAEHGSVKAAADSLFLAPSGVSHAVAELERRVGNRLFARSRTGMRLTPAGHALLEPARQALAAFDAALEAPARVGQGMVGTLEIVSLLTLGQEPTSTLVGELLRLHPSVRVRINEPPGPRVSFAVDSVLAGTNQVAITELPEAAVPGARVTRMRDLEFWVVCPPGSLADVPRSGEDGATVPLEAVLDIGLVVAPFFESSAVYWRMHEAAPDRLDQAIVVRTEHRDSFLTLARAGAGAVLLNRARARRAQRFGCDVGRLECLPARPLAAVTRDGPQPALVEDFLALCASDEVADRWGAA